MKIWTKEELVNFVADHSPYFKKLYEGFDLNNWDALPIIDQDSFWKANTQNDSTVLTAKSEGILFRSGGTTGNPKFSIFTMDEWSAFTSEFARAMDEAGFESGDRVANLFYAGDLYASFLFINKSLENMKTKVVSLPVAGHIGAEAIVSALKQYHADVICGVPTTLMNLRAVSNEPLKEIKKIFYGGESLFDDQLSALKGLFPNATFASIGYASVDGGHLGMSHKGDARGVHRVFEPTSFMEIIDEHTGEVIRDSKRSGRLIYTNLIRSLMPIIRYPVGDSARWVDGHVGSRFILEGRADEGARVGPVTFNRDDFSDICDHLGIHSDVLGFQFEIDRPNALDRLTIKIAVRENSTLEAQGILQAIYSERPMIYKSFKEGLIAAPVILLERLENLAVNTRTGKLKLVIDKRFNP